MSVAIVDASVDTQASATFDEVSRRWVQGLQVDHPARDRYLTRLHALLVRGARHELGRRRGQLGGAVGPEIEDLAQQAADDALVAVLAKLDGFRGASRFTTWAYKFVMFEVSSAVAAHAWRHHNATEPEPDWEHLPDRLAASAECQAELREQMAVLRRAVAEDLTERQRTVFVAVALNEQPVDVVALRLGSNRNAIYKTLFDARTKLRASLKAAGYPLGSPPEP
jgi:RNA polymerase sigma-70 factor (ECF subfamily)